MMPELNELDCRIYVQAQKLEDLCGILVNVLSARQTATPGGSILEIPQGEVEIRKNKEADTVRAGEFPDGFLYFNVSIELYFLPSAEQKECVKIVSKILDQLWSRNIPAVAACDYESDLPRGGGYNDHGVPWWEGPKDEGSANGEQESRIHDPSASPPVRS